ncbi:MAG: pilus assembly PilX N-terminal domain-containing protein [Desulfamplus sp.]|nr:pilus assembly PilX N-terminal domain-containing protein [Desulfamplus sp.]
MNKKIHLYKIILHDDKGSAIVIAMMVLLIVTIIGLSTIDNAITEKTIATNEILHQQAFYAADGGTEVAEQLIQANIDSFTGFTKPAVYKDDDGKTLLTVEDSHLKFWINDPITTDPWVTTSSDDDRDFYMATDPGITNFKIGSTTKFSKGGAIEMAAGYEGRGKSASSGFHLLYDIYAQHKWDDRNVKSTIMVQWRYIPPNTN